MTVHSQADPGRRAFFRESFAKLIRPLGDLIESRMGLLPERKLLRPPGALPEAEFLDTCFRCGSCVEVCPADAIFSLKQGDAKVADTPVIDPDLAACVVCDDLACMKVCPSGALKLVAGAELIRMGVARVDQALCVRTSGEDCTLCIDQCPMGSSALRTVGTGPPFVLDGCVGCGVCQHVCPTKPKAIVVDPV